MLRSSLFTASALALVAGASAQTPQQVNAEKVPGAIKHAGIYHVSTGTWTRTGGAVANFGPDVIYSNTAPSGYFTSFGGAGGGAPGSTTYDEGGLPGSTNASTVWGGPGPNRDEYNANGFEVGYCDLGAAMSGGWEVSFYSEYAPCTAATAAPDAVIQVTGLPAGGCWTVVLDLQGGAEFCLTSDGGAAAPGWDNDATLDSFGWSYRYIGTDGSQPAGFLLNGDPTYTDPTFLAGGLPLDGTGTYYGVPMVCVSGAGVLQNTGYLTQDFWWLEDPTATSSNCYFFGGYVNRFNGCGGPSGIPYASFHMQIWADTAACGSGGTTFGSNYGGGVAVANSTGVPTAIDISGSQTATDDDAVLRAFNMPMNSFGFFITSQTQVPLGNGTPGMGIILIGGNIGRFVAPGQIKNSGVAGEISIDTNLGEWSTQAIPTATGPYAAMAGITSNFQLWHRDAVGGVATSNFSIGLQVDWL